MPFKQLFVTFISLLFLNSAHTQEPTGIPAKLYPVDESHLDPSFAEFKVQLTEAVEKRDLEFLRGAMADRVGLSPWEGSTREQALASFNDEAAEVDLWRELRDALALGATRVELDQDNPLVPKGPRFCAPYVSATFPGLAVNEGMEAITGENVSVHAQPKSSSPVIDTLSYDIVKMGPVGSRRYPPEEIQGEIYRWKRIVTPSGQTGYVYGKYIRHKWGYKACFRKIEGKWMLISLSIVAP